MLTDRSDFEADLGKLICCAFPRVANEFEVNDFFINLEVAFSQETDLLRCNDMCGKDGYLGPLTL